MKAITDTKRMVSTESGFAREARAEPRGNSAPWLIREAVERENRRVRAGLAFSDEGKTSEQGGERVSSKNKKRELDQRV